MSVTPNSNIKILNNVPLDNTYEHTLYFSSVANQQSYFASKVKYSFSNQTYQRVNKNMIRIEKSADNLYDCNYLMFQNTAYGTKWFYAFITEVNYINDNVTEILYEIDDIQTYFYSDCELKYCYVEREHAMDDSLGSNTQSEPINACADIQGNYDIWFALWKVVILASPSALNRFASFIYDACNGIITKQPSSDDNIYFRGLMSLAKWICLPIADAIAPFYPSTAGQFNEKVFCGSDVYVSDHTIDFTQKANEERLLRNEIDRLLALGYTINNMYMIPTEFTDSSIPDPSIPDNFYHPIRQFKYEGSTGFYTPKNNKLLTSPYNYLVVSNKEGQEIKLAYEKLPTGVERKFLLSGVWSNGNCQAMLSLSHYGAESTHEDYITRITLDNFPTCSFSSNGILQILANSIPFLTKSLVGLHNQNVDLNQPTKPESNQSNYEDTNYANTFHNVDIPNLNLSNSPIGDSANLLGTSASSIDIKNNNYGFVLYQYAVNGEDARIIDEFFEKYGYTTNRLKVPNISGRPKWNYVKTKDCIIKGNAPSTSIRRIANCFNRGITFWKNGDEVGNYSLNNH